MPKVADIIQTVERIAPGRLAEEWDNVGLQFGSTDWKADHIFISLDPTPGALSAAVAAGADILITHHPLIFRPLKSIDLNTPVGAILNTAAVNHIAIFSAHTNLDSVKGGVNDVLAGKIGMTADVPLSPAGPEPYMKLVVFVPEDHASGVLDVIGSSPAGIIGNYSSCSFHHKGKGRYVPGIDSTPYAGTPGRLTEADELRVETLVKKSDLRKVIDAVSHVHPYETMAYDIYPLHHMDGSEGIGRIGSFEARRSLSAVAEDIKGRLGLKVVKFAGPPDLMVEKAAVCSGGGAGLLKNFLASPAQVYISGDLNHHAAIDTAAMGKGLIDIGHFASEQLIVPVLGQLIRQAMADAGIEARVTVWEKEPDPYSYI